MESCLRYARSKQTGIVYSDRFSSTASRPSQSFTRRWTLKNPGYAFRAILSKNLHTRRNLSLYLYAQFLHLHISLSGGCIAGRGHAVKFLDPEKVCVCSRSSEQTLCTAPWLPVEDMQTYPYPRVIFTADLRKSSGQQLLAMSKRR